MRCLLHTCPRGRRIDPEAAAAAVIRPLIKCQSRTPFCTLDSPSTTTTTATTTTTTSPPRDPPPLCVRAAPSSRASLAFSLTRERGRGCARRSFQRRYARRGYTFITTRERERERGSAGYIAVYIYARADNARAREQERERKGLG